MSEYLDKFEMDHLQSGFESLGDSDPYMFASWYQHFGPFLTKAMKELSEIPRHGDKFDSVNPKRLASFDIKEIRKMVEDAEFRGHARFEFHIQRIERVISDDPNAAYERIGVKMTSNDLIMELLTEVSRLRRFLGDAGCPVGEA